jgi:hypothetical protein
MDPYIQFNAAKAVAAPSAGLDCDPSEVHPLLKDHQRDTVCWAVQGGRRAMFSAFGLGKTMMQLEAVRLVLAKAPEGKLRSIERPFNRGLIIMPLGVRQEFIADAGKLSITVKFIRTIEEAGEDGIYLTNYETVRDGKLDPRAFTVVSLDEASVLRGFGGTKTFREFMRMFEGSGLYRFVATATPSPNEYIELLAYAAFLEVMDVGQAKTRFFKRDSTNADNLTLHAHKEEEFWAWVASWAMFLQRPSDLGYSDEGYDLPPLNIVWHELASEHSEAGADRSGQGRLYKNSALGVTQASSEKRSSIAARIDKLVEIIAPIEGQCVVWCDLNAEQVAIEQELDRQEITYASLTGTQGLDVRDQLLREWKSSDRRVFISKPTMYGSGVNMQQCHDMVFVGIGFKAKDIIQAVHRIHRFMQTEACTVHFIYTEAEREVRASLERKWAQHRELVANMTGLIREHGLAHAGQLGKARSMGVTREIASGQGWTLANNDAVLEARLMDTDSMGLIITSIPFANQYEYSPNFMDFGHTDDNAHFWAQMGHLIPELLRVLQPGRVAAIHVKDRITPGGVNGFGFQTVQPFSDECIAEFIKHGFAFIARKTIVTDVVRENNQTYRLGWTEQCKDGSRMGAGMPEYVLLFRKPPTDRSNGYADQPVVKFKPLCDDHGTPAAFDPKSNWKQPVPGTGYSRALWQFDAHGFTRSSGNRLLSSEDLSTLPHEKIYKIWREQGLTEIYDFAEHLRFAERMDYLGRLPATFMLLPPHSWHPDVWTDVARMLTLNSRQKAKGKEMHLCPLQLDIVDRLITQFSMEGEPVWDPFSGIGTVGHCALRLRRHFYGSELSRGYWTDGVFYLRQAEAEVQVPTLFDMVLTENAA